MTPHRQLARVAALLTLLAACERPTDSAPATPGSVRAPDTTRDVRVTPAAAPSDPATLLYRDARRQLERGDTTTAVHGFEEVFMRWPRSERASHALYWKAFVMYRRGGTENDQVARNLLSLATQMAPASYAVGDAATLLLRVNHRLAASGDRDALRDLGLADAAALAACEAGAGADRLAWALDPVQSAATRLERLRELMRRRQPCAAPLREQLLLLLARVPDGAGMPDVIAAIDDSSLSVRRNALRVLPAPAPDAARTALESVLRTSDDVLSVEFAAGAWISRPDWGHDPLRAYLDRPDRKPTAAHYIASLLQR